MIGPHYQRLAEAQKQLSGKQMLERIQARTDNPLLNIIDKLKRQFSGYETAYTEDIIDHQISSVDRLLSFDGKLGPILAALQKQNNLLRKELTLMETQLSNTLGICEQVISENNDLKNIIQQKNLDISKIIETIAHNESESLTELEEKISLLQQENSILIQHLQQVKRKHQEYIEDFKAKDLEISKWQHKMSEVKNNLNAVFDRERELSRKLAISEHSLYEEKEKFEAADQKLTALSFENEEMKRKLKMNQNNIKEDINVQKLRKDIEDQYADLIREHKNLKKERGDVMRDAERNKLEKEKMQDILMDMQRKFNKINNEYELTNSLLTQQKQKNQTLVTTLKKIQTKLDELKNQNLQLKMETESSKSFAISREKSLMEELQTLRSQLHQKSMENEKKIRQIKTKYQQLLDSKEMQMKSINQTNTELRRLLERRN